MEGAVGCDRCEREGWRRDSRAVAGRGDPGGGGREPGRTGGQAARCRSPQVPEASGQGCGRWRPEEAGGRWWEPAVATGRGSRGAWDVAASEREKGGSPPDGGQTSSVPQLEAESRCSPAP